MTAAETGARIAAARKKMGMTQKELAERLHVTDKAVSKAQLGASWLFDQVGVYGLPMVLTSGMLPVTGIVLGNALYTLRMLGRIR